MKTVNKLFLSLCLVMGFGAGMAAMAQIDSDVTLEANIPHPFLVGDTQLPAGKYAIRVADDTDLNVLEIRSADGRTAVLFDTESTDANSRPSKSELVFDKIGDRYFLSQVFVEGDASGNQLLKSKMERKLEEGGLKSEKHSIAANKKQSKGTNQSAKRGS